MTTDPDQLTGAEIRREIADKYRLDADPTETARRVAAEFGLVYDDGYLGYVVWNGTGFPSFWNIPDDGATAQECFETQLRRWFAESAPVA